MRAQIRVTRSARKWKIGNARIIEAMEDAGTPSDYIVTATDVEVSDIDLDAEEFVLRDGRRLTEELAEQLASEALADARQRNLIPGGKSLSKHGSHSPTVQFRVPASVREALEEKAHKEGKSASAIARDALISYLNAS